MRVLRYGVALCLALVAPGAAWASPAWETVSGQDGVFRVEMPAGAVYDTSSNMTLAGRIVEHRYFVESADASFWVTWTKLPRVALWLARGDGILGNVRKEVLGRDAVREIAWVPAWSGQLEGRELRYALKRGEVADDGRLRAFVHGRTLVVFHGQARTEVGTKQLDRLLGSIHLDP